jgi:MoxR-like ATPase
MDRAAATRVSRLLIDNVRRVIRGNPGVVETGAITLFAGGHLLIHDVPGVGKTMLGRSLARSIRGTFKRVQATPDLLPSDITGSTVYRGTEGVFEFIPGPVFANIVMVDEINRATPRTQSALLEAMDENAVTVDGVRHPLPEPLFVVATQNPVEHHGTFPLPEGQLDRFAVASQMGYVDRSTERDIVRAQILSHPIEDLESVLNPDDILGVRKQVRCTHISDAVMDYALALCAATRTHRAVELGASPRATIGLVRCAQARALIRGRDFVVPDDVKSLAVAALAHRIVIRSDYRFDRAKSPGIVAEVVQDTPVPVAGSRLPL